MEAINQFFEYMREFHFASVALRLFIATVFGGMLGMERAVKRRAAGGRTYMFVCVGAALAMLLGQYEYDLLNEMHAVFAGQTGNRVDVVRFGAQVINGIGFLGAGTVIVTGRQEVKGLTTAVGLWASACAGLAIGAGFYECALVALILIFTVVRGLTFIETGLIEKSRNMNIYIEFTDTTVVGELISTIKGLDATIYEVDINKGTPGLNPGAIFAIRLNQWRPHAEVLAILSHVDHVITINEV